MVRSHEDKAAATIGGRQVGPVQAPRARSSVRSFSLRANVWRVSVVKPRRTEATRFIMIASPYIYRLLDTPGKNGTAFTALRSLEACLRDERSLFVPLFFDVLMRTYVP